MSQADYFLKIQGIETEGEDKQNPKEFQLQSFSFGASQSGSSSIGGGSGVGKVAMQDFHFTVQNSKASATVVLHLTKGKVIPECKLTCRTVTGDKPEPYLIVVFKDVLISSYQLGGHDGGDSKPMESISFNFTEMKYESKYQDKNNVIKSGGEATWNLKTNVAT